MKPLLDLLTAAASLIVIVGGAWWALEKWRLRDEHFPRVKFEVLVRYLGFHKDDLVTEIVATLENKGVVPLKIRDFKLSLKLIKKDEQIGDNDPKYRNQIAFRNVLLEGAFIPQEWEYSFVYPDIVTEYTFITKIPRSAAFLRVASSFDYLREGESHHVARVFKVPESDVELTPPTS